MGYERLWPYRVILKIDWKKNMEGRGSCPDSVGAKAFSSFFKLGKEGKKRRKRET
jgi:hypothetical protein